MIQPARTQQPWILGLDLGANSLGWVALKIGEDGEPAGLLHPPEEMPTRPSMGVRIFDEGVENYGQGDREASRAVKRRMARLQRRQTKRRARRITKVFNILQSAGLLPAFEAGAVLAHGSPEAARDKLLKELDEQLAQDWSPRVPIAERSQVFELVPYVLRAYALERPLESFALGRALFHLAQRRGFLSNRKTDGKDNERSKVLKDISALQLAIDDLGIGSTLGKYLYQQGLRGERLRRRWTKRAMYVAEFEAIWGAQASESPRLMTDELKERLKTALFHQRPLKDQSGLVGTCEHESGAEYRDVHGEVQRTRRRRRAPECLLVSQRFRIWQTINNIRVKTGDGSDAPLNAERRDRLARELDTIPDITITAAKKLLGISPKVKLNIQDATSKTIRGNRTNHSLIGVFGDRWLALDPAVQEAVVWDIWNAKDNATLVAKARERHGVWARLAPTRWEAEMLDDLVISGDYTSLSQCAMERLLPALQDGLPYATAVQRVYGHLISKEAVDLLGPVRVMFRDLRNPVVSRALNELRRVVNALVREYGKPASVRIELARDMKRGKDDRKRMQENIEKNEGIRMRARERLLQEIGRVNPSGGDILRMRLHEECGGVCPYTGRSIGMSQLLSGEVDVEHIIPFSRCRDDSFTNLTLCFAETNRNEKKNGTPFEAFGHDPERWEGMCDRMRKHVTDRRMSEGKLRRFLMTPAEQAEFLAGFLSSQLNDTRHASLRAREYLTTLFGGDLGRGVDAQGKTRVQVGNGTITALVRRTHGIDRLLPTPPGEKRADHRHHAVDAVSIALTSPVFAQRLSRNAEQEWETRKRRLGVLPDPWPTFVEDVKKCLEQIVPSFRIDNRVRGPLHAESIYSPRRGDSGVRQGDGEYTHIRKPVTSLSPRDIEAIVDPRIRETVTRFLDGRDPKKVCVADKAETHPALIAKDGRRIPIFRVRIKKKNTTYQVGRGGRSRQVENSENHHLVVKDVVDAKGRRKVQYHLVSMFEAYRRKTAVPPEAIIAIDASVRFSLRRNDLVELAELDSAPRLCRVLSISDAEFEGCWATDARTIDVRKREKARVRIGPAKLANGLRCRKVLITPIGVLRPCRV